MPSLIDELYESILKYSTKNTKLLDLPSMMRKSKDKYAICSGNFFFKEPNDIPSAVIEFSSIIEETIKAHIGSKGEIIKNLTHGGIWDSGSEYFEIKGGASFEVYCFEGRTLTFVRVNWEKQLFAPQKEWLSVDVDEIQDALWLEER